MMLKRSLTEKKLSKGKLSQTTTSFFSIVALVVIFILSGCGDDDPTSSQLKNVVDVIISPDSAEFSVGEQIQFSAFVLTEDGDTIAAEDLDVEWEGEWWSSDSDIFTVENNGLATGQNSGEAFCIVELDLEDNQTFVTAGFSIKNTRSIFVGRDSAFVTLLK